MELRKLIQHGTSSLTVSLPSKWLKDRGLVKGDQIQLIEKEGSLILNPIDFKKKDEITIDITGLDRSSICIYIQFIFRLGYKIINIKYPEEKIFHFRKNIKVDPLTSIYEISKRLIGSEITSQTKGLVTVTQITKDNPEDMDKILRRIFLLILDTAKIFLEGIDGKIQELEIIDEKHRTINNFSNYYLRLLNKFANNDEEKRLVNYHIVASLEKIIDIYKHNSRFILKNKVEFSKKSINLIKEVNKALEIYYKLYYSFKQEEFTKITYIRNLLKKEIENNLDKFSKEEIFILSSKKEIPEQLIDLVNFPIK